MLQEGKMFDSSLLGDTEYKRKYETNRELFDAQKTIKTGTAIEWNERSQPFKDPTDPDKDFPKELRKSILNKLTLINKLDLKADDLKYFTSVGLAPLDDYHGIDCYFKININNKERMITIDVSLKNKPLLGEKVRADIFIYAQNDMIAGSNEWHRLISDASREITKKLLSTEELQMEKSDIMERQVDLKPMEIKKEERGENV